jgi:hypothetical protein
MNLSVQLQAQTAGRFEYEAHFTPLLTRRLCRKEEYLVPAGN